MSRTDDEHLEQLKLVRDKIADRLNEVLTTYQPSYMVDGQAVQHTAYLSAIREQLKTVEEEIARHEGPAEELTEIYLGGPYPG